MNSQRNHEGFLPVRNGRINYEIKSGSGEAIVYMHPAIADQRIWDREFEAQIGDTTSIRFDTRGLGQSPPASSEYYPSDDLSDLLDFLKVEKVSLVAASNSGIAAMDFAYRFPKRVNRIMLLASGIEFFDPEPDGSVDEVLSDFSHNFKKINDAWSDGNRELCTSLVMDTFASQQKEQTKDLALKMIRENLEEIVTDKSSAFQKYSISTKALAEFETPTHILVGTKDHPIFHWATRKLNDSIKNSKLVFVEGADHLINLSAPETFDSEFRQFLEISDT